MSDTSTTEIASPNWLDHWLVIAGSDTSIGAPIQLAGSWCASCGRAEFPQRTSCPQCLGETAIRALSNIGTVVGHTAVLHQPPGSLLQAPYGIVAVEHAEGLTVLGPIVGDAWEGVAVGDSVRTSTIAVGDHVGFGYQRE